MVEYKATIKELPSSERPREKLLKYGSKRLTDSELIGLIIGSGSQKKTAVELAQEILYYFGGLQSLENLSVEEFMKLKGIGPAKAAQLKAVVELSRRIFAVKEGAKKVINSPRDVVALLTPELKFLKQEVFHLVLLDNRNQVIATPCISRGSLTSSIVHPREVFKEAVRRSSAAIILAHNHPSGVAEPSNKDYNITERLIDAGKIIGINVLDHIIIGEEEYTSMKEQGIF